MFYYLHIQAQGGHDMCVFVCVCDVFMDKEVLKNNSCEFRGQGASVAILKADFNRIFFS